jgi:hypothetical protein
VSDTYAIDFVRNDIFIFYPAKVVFTRFGMFGSAESRIDYYLVVTGKKRIRSVLPGDTLTAFCKRHKNADAEALARLNRIEDGLIWPGMRLILPDGGGV